MNIRGIWWWGVVSLGVACSWGEEHAAPSSGGEETQVSSVGGAPGVVDPDPGPPRDVGPRCPDRSELKNVYFGDLHVHTSISLDSYQGGNRNDPREAYAFARGRGAVTVAGGAEIPGPEIRIDRPLDFVAVTEHAEFFDVTGICNRGSDNEDSELPYCRAFRRGGTVTQLLQTGLTLRLLGNEPGRMALCRGTSGRLERCERAVSSIWELVQRSADEAYERCEFTTFKAYEWSGQDGMANLHRNVIFAGDAVQERPADFLTHPTAMDLWRSLSRECKAEAGCDAITIPHNANASMGLMWDTLDEPGADAYMTRYQVLTEIYQHKGNSECWPEDGLGDPECSFELLRESFLSELFGLPDLGSKDVGRGYVRSGLARGLDRVAATGSNPLAMGFIGSTDTHNASPGNVREATWPGHAGFMDATPTSRLELENFGPGGLAAAWAEQNTRASIFAAFKRREVYATSGPRMVVRFYAIPGLTDPSEAQRLCDDPSFPRAALEAGGIPMGGTFAATGPVTLLVHALKDEVDLDRVEFVKLDTDGKGSQGGGVEQVVLSDAQRASACVVWRDDGFDPARPSLYYARVLQKPTWRWSHGACAALAEGERPDACAEQDRKIRERAWTSPVFSAVSTRVTE